MAISVVMPALEMAQETGKLVSWLKKEGDKVSKGDLLLEIETDKAVMEVEASADGVLGGITGEVGTDIPVGQTIAWILNPGEDVPAEAIPQPRAATPVTEAIQNSDESSPQSLSANSTARVSPKARRLAKENGIDLTSVQGSGDGGEILASDIQALVDGKDSHTSAVQHESLSSIGRLMAERTVQSWTTVPHFFLQREVDATALNSLRAARGAEVEQSSGVKLTHTDILVALVARALARHPRVNASWIENGVRLNSDVNVSIAMAVEDGVVAPVVHNANTATLAEIAKQRRELTDRAKAGRLRPTDFTGGTFTVSNLGMFHIDSFCAIITPPQAAILAVGQIVERAVAVDGVIVVRPIFSLTISCDHRVLDGAKAATFLHDLAESIREPGLWLK
ncbi:dihydrolipoamide acetyltransferase family protein [Tunturiibacter gelidoferens]|uniref:Pyruvate dehydrogenase E2 component (Dihydrolipoamide acetyltransferase) n=1 Tax=Tunturiibacter gelidiferens TaxID=3069689 RepID=A0ACC5P3Z6_9BACT|nr:dihydrolipoamide acetyltransferase family protein [Edaphobacter lichenicola]MBB5341573.1 pyruvate dehydrogenase E2 component (dihydrolipoamide acetyltransferase) [Edaphobacter lichenicola]